MPKKETVSMGPRLLALERRVGKLERQAGITLIEMHRRFDAADKRFDRTDKKLDKIYNLVDGFAGRVKKLDEEHAALALQMHWLEKRITALEKAR